jgi:hypothetical protein
MIFRTSADRVVRWLDPDALEVEANPLARFVFRAEPGIPSKVGSMMRVIRAMKSRRESHQACQMNHRFASVGLLRSLREKMMAKVGFDLFPY